VETHRRFTARFGEGDMEVRCPVCLAEARFETGFSEGYWEKSEEDKLICEDCGWNLSGLKAFEFLIGYRND
jgi:C4-type Zn-finger protein